MRVAIPVFDQLTALDAVGPYEVLSRLPDTEVVWVGQDHGPIRTDEGMGIVADATFAELTDPEVLVFPGGFGTRRLMRDDEVLDWVRQVHTTSRYTTSVCTGSLVLGAAGLLEGLAATTHWSVLPKLAELGAVPVTERVVEQGKIITAAGVSSGIDMALTLAAHLTDETTARAIQLQIEYDPQPPFDSGRATTVSADVLERAAELAER
jgi:transcriptional regulator GlxA family with amidase domain